LSNIHVIKLWGSLRKVITPDKNLQQFLKMAKDGKDSMLKSVRHGLDLLLDPDNNTVAHEIVDCQHNDKSRYWLSDLCLYPLVKCESLLKSSKEDALRFARFLKSCEYQVVITSDGEDYDYELYRPEIDYTFSSNLTLSKHLSMNSTFTNQYPRIKARHDIEVILEQNKTDSILRRLFKFLRRYDYVYKQVLKPVDSKGFNDTNKACTFSTSLFFISLFSSTKARIPS